MRRGRSKRWQGEAFGTSLADILTTALGCVLLLFLVAVMNIRTTLSREQTAHERTRTKLSAEEQGRVVAEQEKQVELGRRRAIEQALRDEAAARGEAQLALRAAEARSQLLEKALIDAQASAQVAEQRLATLREVATHTVSELDPRTASPVDVMIVVDGTKSMKPSLDATRQNLHAAIKALRVVSPTARVGVTVFRDKREKKNVRLQSHPLTDDIEALARFLDGIEATSSWRDTDRPEWLCGGMEAATKSRWRDNALKLMLIATDAAGQADDTAGCEALATKFRKDGGRVYVLSTLPSGYGDNPEVTEDYESAVVPEHAAIAAAGGGVHVRGADSEALLTEVLRAAFHQRTDDPLRRLREAAEAEPARVE